MQFKALIRFSQSILPLISTVYSLTPKLAMPAIEVRPILGFEM